jgi:hypothetical protein
MLHDRPTAVHDALWPDIATTYGDNGVSRALAAYLAEKITNGEFEKDSRGREYRIMVTCWNWFSGGTTAESVAKKIEQEMLKLEALT